MSNEVRRFKVYADDGTEYIIIGYVRTKEVFNMLTGTHEVQDALGDLLTEEGGTVYGSLKEGTLRIETPSGPVAVHVKEGEEGSSAQ